MYNLYNKGSISLGKMRPATTIQKKKKIIQQQESTGGERELKKYNQCSTAEECTGREEEGRRKEGRKEQHDDRNPKKK